MANTNTIKQRFIDILFEDETGPILEKKSEVKKNNNQIKDNKKKDFVSIQAKDLLYGKKEEKQSAFINLNEEIKNVNTEKLSSVKEFTPSPNLSPIFGAIDTNTKKSEELTSVDYASVAKPDTSYLDMVLSPIYGYDTKSANEARSNLLNDEKTKVFENVDITDDLVDIFATTEHKRLTRKTLKREVTDKTAEIDLFSDFYAEKED